MNENKSRFKVAAIQDSPVFLNKDATIEKACALIKKAASNGASLVLFPETFISAYPDWVWTVPPSNTKMMGELFKGLHDSAITVPDNSIDKLCKAAKDSNIFVIIGANEKNSDLSNASLYNSIIYISAEGELLGTHRKLIPTGGERLMWVGGDGKSLVSFDTELGKIGGLIPNGLHSRSQM